MVALVVGGLLLGCLLYCLIAPNQYEASAKVALRQAPASALGMEAAEPMVAASILSAPLQLETLANVFRSERLAWRVITKLKLYEAPGFKGRFDHKFPGFRPEAPGADAKEWLLERFHRRLIAESLPRTLVLEIRFRSRDAALSAAVVNEMIRAYNEQESESRLQATAESSAWLQGQLKDIKARVDEDEQRLSDFQNEHGILGMPEVQDEQLSGQGSHSAQLMEMEAAGQELAEATSDRIVREAEFRAAAQGDPELAAVSDRGRPGGGNMETTLLEQIRAQRSALEQEQALLGAEHGPNFPRVVEIRRQLQDLDGQKQAANAKLVERFHAAWQMAADREELMRKNLDARTAAAMKMNAASAQFLVMAQEAKSSHALYLRVLEKVEEGGLAAGIQSSNISVVDYAREPSKPVAPDLPIYMAITLFAGLWLAVGGALLVESLHPSVVRAGAALLAVLLIGAWAQGQAPTPSTSGLPTGVVRIPATPNPQKPPNPQDSSAVWDSPQSVGQAGLPVGNTQPVSLMAAPIGPGDSLDVTEFHTPEFHSQVRVSARGTVALPMVGEVHLDGLDEQGAAHVIEEALIGRGMLLHPQVSVMVTAYVGQDVSVLGEVARPGVYPYTLHHRLLDLISVAYGLSPSAGRLVNIFHRDDPKTPHPVVLDPSGTDTAAEHNPELAPGDTVQVSRAGLVYVIGDVVRPGGFPVDPAQGLTVVQALSLAWGTTQTAATRKALLIREQKGGRTLTSLDLKRMMHGQEPDQPVHDRDILFVPDSTAKDLWNKGLEAAVQSAVGLPIYGVMVYSQWFNRPATSSSTGTVKKLSPDYP
jgi:polysaccharide export outer membrane protein